MSVRSDLDLWQLRLEALGRLQARYAWWLVLSSVFLLALHMSLRDCGVVPGGWTEAWASAWGGDPLPPSEGVGVPVEGEGGDGNPAGPAEAPTLCAGEIVTVPLLGISLSALVIWTTGPLFLAFLSLVFLGSFIAAAEAGMALGYLREYGETPAGFIDTVPNGIDLAFAFHPAFAPPWTGVAKSVASFKYQLFVALILIQSAILWIHALAVWRGGGEGGGFLGQFVILVAAAAALVLAGLRLAYLAGLRVRAIRKGARNPDPLAALAREVGRVPDEVRRLGAGMRAWAKERDVELTEEQVLAILTKRLSAPGVDDDGDAPALRVHVLDPRTVAVLEEEVPGLKKEG